MCVCVLGGWGCVGVLYPTPPSAKLLFKDSQGQLPNWFPSTTQLHLPHPAAHIICSSSCMRHLKDTVDKELNLNPLLYFRKIFVVVYSLTPSFIIFITRSFCEPWRLHT